MRLALEPDIEVIGDCGDGLSALALAEQLEPDVIVMDVSMPCMDGISAALALQNARGTPRIVMLSLYDDLMTTNRSLAAGAVAFVPKRRMDNLLVDAIRRAAS